MSKGIEIIESVLREHYGDAYKPEENAPRGSGNGRDPLSSSPYDQANDLAMKNFDAWVPHLGIYKLRPQRGRHRSYIGVAQWRESSTAGRGLDQREPNLKICGSGIKDFGDGKGYTPIDLVGAAKNVSPSEALEWLEGKLGVAPAPALLDIEAITAKQAEGAIEEPKANVAPAAGAPDKPGVKPPPGPRIRLQPYLAPDPTKIPRRQWLYGFHYLRKTVSATIGPGGIGKSSLGLVEAIGMALGHDLLNGKRPLPVGRLRLWYHNGEDSSDELDRRIAAICQHYKVSSTVLYETLFVTCGLDMPIKVASGSLKVTLDKALKAEIVATIREQKIDVCIFDPLVTMHSTQESMSFTMDPVIRDVFAAIANETDTAIELAHHVRKKAFGQEEYTTADARGSVTLIDAVRGARVANPMSKAEGERFGIEEEDRDLYFRIDKGKANLVRRGPSNWYRFESVPLPNGDDENPPDVIGVLTAWRAPEISSEIDQDDRFHFHDRAQSRDHLRDKRSKKWFGDVVAERMGWKTGSKSEKKRVDLILDLLLKEGVVRLETRTDPKGNAREYIVPGAILDCVAINTTQSEDGKHP